MSRAAKRLGVLLTSLIAPFKANQANSRTKQRLKGGVLAAQLGGDGHKTRSLASPVSRETIEPRRLYELRCISISWPSRGACAPTHKNIIFLLRSFDGLMVSGTRWCWFGSVRGAPRQVRS